MAEAFGGFSVIVFLFLLILAILWFFLPFAIFGTKDKLAALILETKKTNAELAVISTELISARLHREQSSQISRQSDA